MVNSFAFLNPMRQTYGNKIELKLVAFIISVVISSELAYKYHHWHLLIRLSCGLLTHVLIYCYMIPLLLIYLYPVRSKITQLWYFCIDTFSDKILRSYSTKLCQMLPFICTLESNDNIWPIENLRRMIKFSSFVIAIYFSLKIYSYLFFGVIFNLYITIAVTILIVRTLWYFIDAIDCNLYPFIFIMIIQYFILPTKSLFYIPVILLLTAFLFPFLNQLLISHSIDQLINNIQLFNFRTYIELDDNYKQCSAEVINLFVTSGLVYHIFVVCLTNNLSWILTIPTITILPIFLYTNLIYLISIQPSWIMFLISSTILTKYILYQNLFNMYLLIMILASYFVFIYPLFYLSFRRLTINLSNKTGLKLKLIREKIHRIYLPWLYGRSSSRYSTSRSSNTLDTVYQLVIRPTVAFLRLFLILFN